MSTEITKEKNETAEMKESIDHEQVWCYLVIDVICNFDL